MSADYFLNKYEDLKSTWEKRSSSILALQDKAMEKYSALGLPTLKSEHWKYTPIAQRLLPSYETPKFVNVAIKKYKNQITLINGVFDKENTSVFDQGVQVFSLTQETLSPEQAEKIFFRLNCFEDGFEAAGLGLASDLIYINATNKNTLESPLVIQQNYLAQKSSSMSHSNIYIEVEAGASILIILEDEYIRAQEFVSNHQLYLNLGENAHVQLVQLVSGSENYQYIGRIYAQQAKNSSFHATVFTAGGKTLRCSTTVEQRGEAAETEVNGLYLVEGGEHVDHRIQVRHLVPQGQSRQLFKGVLKDSSRAVCNGKIYIAPGAQKVDSSQLNNNLVLSRHAEADSKPELEVYADDVKANHGSAIGRLDEDQLFYLMSRAVDRSMATKILAKGFVDEVLLKVRSNSLRTVAHHWLQQKLQDFQESLERSRSFQ
ncbi:MAG: Fe-S cluster assembly protein SufD [Bdellovibrionales bacterium]|nr:Fe-S cluster assembly protein SufD [Bdellovibrionales bacterium]